MYLVFDIPNAEPPSFGANTCPSDMSVTTDQGSSAASVTWNDPIATDNSGDVPAVECVPPQGRFAIGVREVTCTASDSANPLNVMSGCIFTITVRGNCKIFVLLQIVGSVL